MSVKGKKKSLVGWMDWKELCLAFSTVSLNSRGVAVTAIQLPNIYLANHPFTKRKKLLYRITIEKLEVK